MRRLRRARRPRPDRGSLEYLGVSALLVRGFRRLIVCFVTAQPLRRDKGAAVVCCDRPPPFGLQPYAPGLGYQRWGPTRGSGPSALQRHSQVFPSPDFQTLADGLLATHVAGGTATVEQTLDVQPNPCFAVPGGHPVRLLWICNAQVPAWWDALSWEVRAAVEAEALGHFPLYLTIEQLELSATLVNALAHLSCWNLASDAAIPFRLPAGGGLEVISSARTNCCWCCQLVWGGSCPPADPLTVRHPPPPEAAPAAPTAVVSATTRRGRRRRRRQPA